MENDKPGKGRVTLKEYFKADKMPTEGNFGDLVDSALNKTDDQLFIRPMGDEKNPARYLGIGSNDPESPLSIRNRTGGDKMIGFEDSGGDEEWHISINPEGGHNGLIIQNNNRPSANLMLDADGKLGVGIKSPKARVHIKPKEADEVALIVGKKGGNAGLRIGYDSIQRKVHDGSEGKLLLNPDGGNVGIGISNPKEKLHVAGTVKASKLEGQVSWNNLTDMPNSLIPSRVIVMWSGTISEIPPGWRLCNGSNNTPDLRGRFVIGASREGGSHQSGRNYSNRFDGGAEFVKLEEKELPEHRHDKGTLSITSSGSHTHTVNAYSKAGESTEDGSGHHVQTNSGPSATASGGSHTHPNNNFSGLTGYVGNNKSHENRPPFYALAYIMKI